MRAFTYQCCAQVRKKYLRIATVITWKCHCFTRIIVACLHEIISDFIALFLFCNSDDGDERFLRLPELSDFLNSAVPFLLIPVEMDYQVSIGQVGRFNKPNISGGKFLEICTGDLIEGDWIRLIRIIHPFYVEKVRGPRELVVNTSHMKYFCV